MTSVKFGLSWDARTIDGKDFDLDASALVVCADGNVVSSNPLGCFTNLKSPEEPVVHKGDNLTGEGEGDDEVMVVDLPKLPAGAEKVVFAVTIYDGKARGQNFGQVNNAFIRAVDGANESEVMRFDLSEDYATESTFTFGELYRRGEEWKFKAIGAGYADGLQCLTREYGV